MSTQHESQTYLERYGTAMMGVFGEPGLVLTEGDGCYVTDADAWAVVTRRVIGLPQDAEAAR